MFSNLDLAKCAEREAGQREWVYPKRVADHKMTQEKADREISMMRAIAEHFRARAEEDRKLEDLFG
jgi:hypothetical protein